METQQQFLRLQAQQCAEGQGYYFQAPVAGNEFAKLQKTGLIHYARGHITVLDRSGLEERSCECYSVVKKEYARLLPDKPAT